MVIIIVFLKKRNFVSAQEEKDSSNEDEEPQSFFNDEINYETIDIDEKSDPFDINFEELTHYTSSF